MKQNQFTILIGGKSGVGKTASLMFLPNQEGVAYMNCDGGKEIPFNNKFKNMVITNPLQIEEAFKEVEKHDSIHTIVIDTLTFLMDMYESQKVLTASAENKFKAWSDYAQFFKHMMQDNVAKSTKNVIFLAHTMDILNEGEGVMETLVKVKGSTMNQGVEAYFCNVIAAKKIALTKLEKYKNKLLIITPEDELLGFKYVYQTRVTKDTFHERIRSPMGMWEIEETFIDNNAQFLMNRLHEYYK